MVSGSLSCSIMSCLLDSIKSVRKNNIGNITNSFLNHETISVTTEIHQDFKKFGTDQSSCLSPHKSSLSKLFHQPVLGSWHMKEIYQHSSSIFSVSVEVTGSSTTLGLMVTFPPASSFSHNMDTPFIGLSMGPGTKSDTR